MSNDEGVFSVGFCFPNYFSVKGSMNITFSPENLSYNIDNLKDALRAYMYVSNVKFKTGYNLNKFISELFEETFKTKYTSSKLRNDSIYGELLIASGNKFVSLNRKNILEMKKYSQVAMTFSPEYSKDNKLLLYVPFSPLDTKHIEVTWNIGKKEDRNRPRQQKNEDNIKRKNSSPQKKSPQKKSPQRKSPQKKSPQRKNNNNNKRVSPRRTNGRTTSLVSKNGNTRLGSRRRVKR